MVANHKNELLFGNQIRDNSHPSIITLTVSRGCALCRLLPFLELNLSCLTLWNMPLYHFQFDLSMRQAGVEQA